MRMHYLKHHAEELDVVQVKWKKGYYTAEDGHIVPDTTFYPSEHPFSAVDDPAFLARHLELREERQSRPEAAQACSPMVRMNSASGMYRQEAKRWESEAPPRKRSRTPSPPRSCRNSREDRQRGADGEGLHYSYGSGDNRHQGREPGAAGGYPRDDPPCREQPAHVRYEANADRARQAEKERDELAQ